MSIPIQRNRSIKSTSPFSPAFGGRHHNAVIPRSVIARLQLSGVRTVPYFPVTPTLRVRFVCKRPVSEISFQLSTNWCAPSCDLASTVVGVDEPLVRLAATVGHCRTTVQFLHYLMTLTCMGIVHQDPQCTVDRISQITDIYSNTYFYHLFKMTCTSTMTPLIKIRDREHLGFENETCTHTALQADKTVRQARLNVSTAERKSGRQTHA